MTIAICNPVHRASRATDMRDRLMLKAVLVGMALFTWGVLVPYSLFK